MLGLTTDDVSAVCRIFLAMAYPDGEETIPELRRVFLHLPDGNDFHAYQETADFSPSCFQINKKDGVVRGYSLRLGSKIYPHLKLKIHWVTEHGQQMWVYTVDTHDAFLSYSSRPPADHPDAEVWMKLQAANTELKEQIEHAWEEQGYLTFNGLLRNDLKQPPQPKS